MRNNIFYKISKIANRVAPYYIVDEHTRIPELQLISQTTYDKLTEEEKERFRNAVKGVYSKYCGNYMDLIRRIFVLIVLGIILPIIADHEKKTAKKGTDNVA